MKKNGFTLVEVVVATGIFTTVLLVVSGIFTQHVSSQRRDSAELTLQEDMRFAIESFTREARTAYGSTFALGQTGPLGESIVFRNQNSDCVSYRLSQNTWQRGTATTGSTDCDNQTYQNYAAITSPRLQVTLLKFIVPSGINGQNGKLARQGFITVTLEAQHRTASIPAIALQSTVTSRQVIPYPTSQ